MSDTSACTIRSAASVDLEQIVALAESYALGSVEGDRLASDGFLVSGFDAASYADWLRNADHFYVASTEEGIVGFMLAYSDERIRPGEWLNLKIKERVDSNFVLVKQLCVKRGATGRGVARRLYGHLLAQAPERPLYGAIVTQPRNERSIEFHERLGFRKVFEATPPDDDLPRGVWMRPALAPAGAAASALNLDAEQRLQVCLERYRVAVDLYKHEDLLNWNKLQHLLYVSAGLFVAETYLLELRGGAGNGLDTSLRMLLTLVALLGLGSAWIFGNALRSGVAYLHRRKDTAACIERNMLAEEAYCVLLVQNDHGPGARGASHRSLTTKMLLRVPSAIGIAWIAVILLVWFVL